MRTKSAMTKQRTVKELIDTYEYQFNGKDITVEVKKNIKGVYEVYWRNRDKDIKHYMFGLSETSIPSKLYLMQIIDSNIEHYVTK